MSDESTVVAFPGALSAGQIRGTCSRPWNSLLQQMQIDAGAIPPTGGPLVLQILLGGVLQPQQFSLADGDSYAEIDFDGSGLAVPAGTLRQVQCVTASGASDVNATLIGTNEIYGDAQFGDAQETGTPVTITTFLTAADVANYIASSKLIEALDDPVNPTGTLNATLQNSLLNRVNGEMRSYIEFRVKWPIVIPNETVNDVLGTIGGFALDLFWYYANADKPHFLESYKGVGDKYKQAIAWLCSVRDGKVTIGTSQVVPGAEARTAAVETQGHKGTFNRDRMRGW